jgi:hypothetical protein
MFNFKNCLWIFYLDEVAVWFLQIDVDESVTILFTDETFVGGGVLVAELPSFFFVDVEKFVSGNCIVKD